MSYRAMSPYKLAMLQALRRLTSEVALMAHELERRLPSVEGDDTFADVAFRLNALRKTLDGFDR